MFMNLVLILTLNSQAYMIYEFNMKSFAYKNVYKQNVYNFFF